MKRHDMNAAHLVLVTVEISAISISAFSTITLSIKTGRFVFEVRGLKQESHVTAWSDPQFKERQHLLLHSRAHALPQLAKHHC